MKHEKLKDSLGSVSDEPVNTGNPCRFCHCDPYGHIVCASIDCLPCYGVVVPVVDQCCGDCFIGTILVKFRIGCARCGVKYKIGKLTSSC